MPPILAGASSPEPRLVAKSRSAEKEGREIGKGRGKWGREEGVGGDPLRPEGKRSPLQRITYSIYSMWWRICRLCRTNLNWPLSLCMSWISSISNFRGIRCHFVPVRLGLALDFSSDKSGPIRRSVFLPQLSTDCDDQASLRSARVLFLAGAKRVEELILR